MGSLRVRHDWTTSLSLSCIGEGNGNSLQCFCLQNPRDGGAWWAAIYGVTQSRTRLKWLSSSSSSNNKMNNHRNRQKKKKKKKKKIQNQLWNKSKYKIIVNIFLGSQLSVFSPLLWIKVHFYLPRMPSNSGLVSGPAVGTAQTLI